MRKLFDGQPVRLSLLIVTIVNVGLNAPSQVVNQVSVA